MKQIILLLSTVFYFQSILAQDVYKKRYYVKDSIKYVEKFYIKDLKDSSKYNVKSITKFLKLEMVNNKEITSETMGLLKQKRTRFFLINIVKGHGLKANVAFDEKKTDILWINPWLVEKPSGGYVDRDSVYFFRLQNRQSVRINFRQWSLNALTIPLKVRFGDEKDEFSTGANLGALIGHTWGKTNFVHRKKVGNKQYDSKVTLGLFLGADKLEFSYKNSSNEDVSVKTALISSGLGVLYSYQNFTLGITSGLDFGLGENSSEWDYQGKPWVGFALGYSLFSF